MNAWNNIYASFDPVAFHIFSFPVHWYGMMYVLALVSALYIASYIIKKDSIDFKKDELDIYFIYVEIGVILGARLGYLLFYDSHIMYYLTNPLQIFNPFDAEGNFIGIRGMSFHGAVIGFVLSSYIYCKKYKISFGMVADLAAISIPLAYVFGRIGNFLNQELIGRETDVSWGILVDGVLRHPSQLYEAFLEGIVVFMIVYIYRKYKRFSGELILVYGFSYGLLRSIAEIWRAPDAHIGYVCCDFITLGQSISLGMSGITLLVWIYFYKKYNKNV
jgi:phosphatidylglycerol:prolipoprotein diacylglycerol transferase